MKFARLLGIAFLVLGLASPHGVYARSSHSGSNGQGGPSSDSNNGNGNGNGNGNSQGNGNDQGNGNGHGNSGADSNNGNGNGGGRETAPGQSKKSAPDDADQDAALDAVRSGEAVPLDSIVANVRQTVGGEVLDAHQFTYRGFLLYEIKVLQPGGKVKSLYYYAKSGLPAGR